jgi:hypothetical protein
MRIGYARVGLLFCAAVALLWASAALAQDDPVKPTARGDKEPPRRAVPADSKDAAAHRLEIYNGPVRTVHYFTHGLSTNDQSVLRDLESAENELTLAEQMAALRYQYVRDEQTLQSARKAMLEQLAIPTMGPITGVYPDEIVPVDLSAIAANTGYYRGWAGSYWPTYGGYPYATNGASSYNYPSGAYGGAPQSLAMTVDESRLKTELVQNMVKQDTPERVAMLRRNRDVAMSRAAGSERLRADLNLPKSDIRGADYPVGERSPGDPINVTLKAGDPIKGKLVREDNDRIVIDTGKEDVEIRRSEAMRITWPHR